MNRPPQPGHIRLVPPATAPAPSLDRLVEQLLAQHPQGLPWRVLLEEVAIRRRARGCPAPDADGLVRVLGTLLVSGRVDERGGRFVLRAAGRGAAARLSA